MSANPFCPSCNVVITSSRTRSISLFLSDPFSFIVFPNPSQIIQYAQSCRGRRVYRLTAIHLHRQQAGEIAKIPRPCGPTPQAHARAQDTRKLVLFCRCTKMTEWLLIL